MHRLIKYSSVITSFLIYIGYLKLKFYYDYFGIQIIDYLDFSEIITSFLNDLNIVMAVSLIAMTHMGLGLLLLKSSYNFKRENKKDFDVISRLLGRKISKAKTRFQVVALLLSLTLSFVGFYLFMYKLITIGLYLFVLFFLQLIVIIFDLVQLENLIDKRGFFSLGISIVIVFSSVSFLLAKRDFAILRNKDFSGYTIQTDSSKYLLQKNDYLIGKVKDYIFLQQKDKIVIINMSKVNKILFPHASLEYNTIGRNYPY